MCKRPLPGFWAPTPVKYALMRIRFKKNAHVSIKSDPPLIVDSKEGSMAAAEDDALADIKNPHDKFFKLVFGDVGNLMDFMRWNLPLEIRRRLDLESLEIVPGSYLEEDFSENFNDLLARVSSGAEESGSIFYSSTRVRMIPTPPGRS